MILTRSDNPCSRLQALPGTFAGLMDLYERNYIGIRRLVPVMPPAQASLTSRAPGGLDLHLVIVERFRYTTELSLTYHFSRGAHLLAEPDLRIRVYHDARLAEVMSAHLRHRPRFQAQEGDSVALYFRWRINRFLYKWLSYCLHQGHRFGGQAPTVHGHGPMPEHR